MAVPGKQYGLILPQKNCLTKPTRLQKHSVFGDDSDDETSVRESLQKEAAKKKTMRQTQLEMKKALEEDSTVYDYDAVYDDIQKQRLDNSRKVLSGAEKKPKYIHQLMKAVESRKKEQERREERKIQKEREAEGEQFADKEAYVTSAYKRKLQEQEEEEERERREAAIEAALDVRKQKDLSGFYRHLLNQTVGEAAVPDRLANKSQKSEDVMVPETSQTSVDITSSPGSDGEDAHEKKNRFHRTACAASSSHSKRHYRLRSPSSGSECERERDACGKKGRDKDGSHGKRRQDSDGESHRSRRQDREREEDGRRMSDKDEGREEKMRKDEDGNKAPRGKEEDEGCEREDEGEKGEKVTVVNKFAKRSNEQTLSSARDRYLARQMARSAAKCYIERDED
ncbi:nuclear speckle splicing regulatory protein 1 isoform X2 [Phyllopteryx taeniolatus]|uniref:nuclear speckle splicing regulatory protein 1 isoform X2 n=1 Tax=Phyllopteryx taeniolatus TaxID=161469 RepID=UPI002AD359F4|nr:nuclear speckle splicing regulatory protein 1 isoform X2 [Phyllopteryx taeniolatus]